MRLFLAAMLFPLLCVRLHAELVFDQNPLELKPSPADDEIEARFTFHNGGDKPLRVTDLTSTCSCLEATLDKAVYQPGEKGSGTARFKVSSFTGRHEKILHIHTDDRKNPTQVLTTVIDIPTIVDIEPKTVRWTLGDAADAKIIRVRVTGPDSVHIKNISSTRESFTFILNEVTPGREYQIHLQPKDTDQVVIGALRIETDSKYPRHTRQLAFFSIERPEQAAKRATAGAANDE